ncbi:MAG: pyridoxamine 5'-phosphate oxidase family protein [Syntrophaceae bacterium]|nr:pyridoxamine 5'-phosphate oxidase family protein [Syntrophaceae bacterium]
MRVAKKEIRDQAVLEMLLAEARVGRLGTVGRGGWPMIKPLNFIHYRGRIYFHSAREGGKIEQILLDGRVCFEVDFPLTYVKSKGIPCKADYLYRSVIARGQARPVTDEDEKEAALKALMEKYQPEGGYGTFPGDKLALTAVVRIDIAEMTGKEDLGEEYEQAAVHQLLANPSASVMIERS